MDGVAPGGGGGIKVMVLVFAAVKALSFMLLELFGVVVSVKLFLIV